MLLAHKNIGGCRRGGGSGLVALEFGMAEIAFVLIDAVLGAVETFWIFDFRMAKETAVFVAVMLLAPESSGIAF